MKWKSRERPWTPSSTLLTRSAGISCRRLAFKNLLDRSALPFHVVIRDPERTHDGRRRVHDGHGLLDLMPGLDAWAGRDPGDGDVFRRRSSMHRSVAAVVG